MIDKEFCKVIEEQKLNTPENFYKLLMFVYCMAGDGIGYNNCFADDLLFGDILKDNIDCYKLDMLSEEFTENYGVKNDS